jgi:hypothetical protein
MKGRRFFRISLAAVGVMLLIGVAPGLLGVYFGAWLPRAVVALGAGGWAGVASIPFWHQRPNVPRGLQYWQMAGSALFSIPLFAVGPKIWRPLLLKWKLATEAELEDFEKHAE